MGNFETSRDPYFSPSSESAPWRYNPYKDPVILPEAPKTKLGQAADESSEETSEISNSETATTTEFDPHSDSAATTEFAENSDSASAPSAVPRWKAPTDTPDWSAPQPYSASSLDKELQNKTEMFQQAREPQRGSRAAAAVAAIVPGLISEPLTKLSGLDNFMAPKLTAIDPFAVRAVTAESKWFSVGGTLRNTRAAVFGTAGVAGVLELDARLRSSIYKDELPSWESTSLTVPLAFALGRSTAAKIVVSEVAVGAGHLLDNLVPAPAGVPESLKHLTPSDGLLLGAGFAIPTKSRLLKAALISTAWVGGNLLESAVSTTSAGDIERRAIDATTIDESERSKKSMDSAVELFKELGQKNEVILEEDFARILSNLRNSDTSSDAENLALHRNALIVSRATSEHYLEHGSKLSPDSVDHPTYVLEGLNLDVGANALQHLFVSKAYLDQTRQLTRNLIGTEINGKDVTERELDELDVFESSLDQSMDKILGKHDIPEAINQLSKFFIKGTTSDGAIMNSAEAKFYTFTRDLNKNLGVFSNSLYNQDGSLDTTSATLTAKLLRDQALVQITAASVAIESGHDPEQAQILLYGTSQGRSESLPGSNQPKGYDGALQALELAEHLDSDNRDLDQLKQAAARITMRL